MNKTFEDDWQIFTMGRVKDIVISALEDGEHIQKGTIEASCRDAYKTGFQDAIKLMIWQ